MTETDRLNQMKFNQMKNEPTQQSTKNKNKKLNLCRSNKLDRFLNSVPIRQRERENLIVQINFNG